jgi:uncharacterized membrane protein
MAENRDHARLSEDRRIVITSVAVFAASALLIALSVLPSNLRTLPLALWLTIIGVGAALACLKLYERSQLHELRARRLRARLIELTPDSGAESAQQEADDEHIRDHSRLAALRFNSVLLTLNLAVALIGVLYIVLALIHAA